MPLVLGQNGEKLSKQNGAQALDLQIPMATLNQASKVLGLSPCKTNIEDALHEWTQAWLSNNGVLEVQRK